MNFRHLYRHLYSVWILCLVCFFWVCLELLLGRCGLCLVLGVPQLNQLAPALAAFGWQPFTSPNLNLKEQPRANHFSPKGMPFRFPSLFTPSRIWLNGPSRDRSVTTSASASARLIALFRPRIETVQLGHRLTSRLGNRRDFLPYRFFSCSVLVLVRTIGRSHRFGQQQQQQQQATITTSRSRSKSRVGIRN